ncbi:competence protein CoiA [Phocicoccus schoeneichii]|uniref:competence protein CoiA n=1 Tax=Phocicoccus schoeneichii TaxID=1812261 RepID=UPI003D13E4E4
MLIAYDQYNQLKNASLEKKNSENCYFCPSCKEKVFLKQGTKNMPHFSHYKNSECQSFSEGETEEHIRGKYFLYHFLKPHVESIEMEPYIKTLKQRPDLLITKNKQKIAIEFQCSSISVKDVLKRSKGYKKADIIVLWIIGSPLILNTRLTQLHRAMMNQYVLTTPNLLYLDIINKQLIIHHHFHYLDRLKWSTSYLTRFVTMKDLPEPYNIQLVDQQIITQKAFKELRRMQYFKTKNARCFFNKMYNQGDNLFTLPSMIFLPCEGEWTVMTPGYAWKYDLYHWINNFEQDTIISKDTVRLWLKKQIGSGRIKLYIMPNIDAQYRMRCFSDFMDLLESEGVLFRVNDDKWCRC